MNKVIFSLLFLSSSLAYSTSSSINNPVLLNLLSVCSGTTLETTEGTFSQGLEYEFVTNGTDVTINFVLLDTDKPGLNPELFSAPSTFLPLTANGSSYSTTLTNQTVGAILSFQFRGAYEAGGLVVSRCLITK